MQRQDGHPVRIAGTGSFLPGDPIPFDEVESILGEFDDVDADFKRWYKRTRRVMKQLLGVEYYFYAIDPETKKPTETPSSMAAKAGKLALDEAGMTPKDVDFLLYAGASQDSWVCPPTSVFVQEHLGIEQCAEATIQSNCTSTYKALQFGADQIAYGRSNTVLITTANQLSRYLMADSFNQKQLTRDQATIRWFLCDGAGAILLTRDDGTSPGLQLYDTYLESVGLDRRPHMYTRHGTCHNPKEAWDLGLHHLNQDFSKVSTIGPDFFLDGIQRFAAQKGIDPADKDFIDQLRFFLANVPADHLMDIGIDSAKSRLRIPLKKIRDSYYSTVSNRGYTGPAAIAITLDELMKKEELHDGEYVVSFVTESSKWMNAGFITRYRA